MMLKNWLAAFVAAVLAFGMTQTVRGEQAPERSGKADAWSEIVALANSKQPEAAYRLALRHENDGDPRIWTFLGDCLSYGRGVESDHRRSFEYYCKAAERIPYAKYRMGLFYATGTAAPCDKDKAVELMDEALAAGYRPSDRLIQQTMFLLRTELSEYADPELKLRFPARSEKFGLAAVQRYLNHKVLGYSLRYNGNEEWLDLYVYDHGWGVIPNGISEVSDKALAEAGNEVQQMLKSGMYKNFRDRSGIIRGVLPLSKLEYAWFSFVYDPQGQKDLRSVILIFGARGKFFKIRYSGVSEKDVPPEQLPTMVADFLKHLDAALTAE